MVVFEISLLLGLVRFAPALAPAPSLPQKGTVGVGGRLRAGEEEMEVWQ